MALWRTLLAPLAPRLCAACGGVAGAAEPLCADCRARLRWLPGSQPAGAPPAWAPIAYEGPARDILHAFKFGGRAALAGPLAAQIAARAPAGLLAGTLVPVPLHPRRMSGRGYNQAAELAAALAKRTGLALADCLERGGDPATQAGRGRRARLAGVAGSIRVRGQSVQGRAVLVDDVVTTGATLAACAAALRAAGAAEVAAVAWARTSGR